MIARIFLILLMGTAAQADYTMPRSGWLDFMADYLPTLLCQSDGYFGKCYSIDTTGCRAAAARELISCAQNLSLPETIDIRTTGDSYAQKIGECVGNTLERAWFRQKSKAKDCEDLKAWE